MHRLKAENPIDTFIERLKKAKAWDPPAPLIPAKAGTPCFG